MYARRTACLLWFLLLISRPGAAQTPALSSGVPSQPSLASPPLPPPAPANPPPPAPAALRRPRVLRLQTEAADQLILKRYKYQTMLPDSLGALREVRALVLALQGDAYLTASADELRWAGRDTLRVRLYVGEKFRWARLRNGNLGDGLLTRAGYRERFFQNKPFQPADWARLQERILTEAENQGFPFATVGLDSVALRGADISGRVVLRRGRAVTFDSIQVVGNTKTKKRFLTKYLQIFPNQPYSQQRVAAAAQLLRQLPYLRLRAEPEVRFARGQARVYFLIDDRPANQFDAIVGVVPNTGGGTNSNKSGVQITGEATINLRNLKGGGKQAGVQWRKTDAKSQLLDAQYVHPNFFGSPLEVGATLNLYRQTGDFLTLRPRLEVSYPTARAGRLTFFTEQRSSRLLADSATNRARTSLPENIDSRYGAYGLGYARNNLDDLYFPRRGTLVSGQAAVGSKTIRRNADLNDTLYRRLPLRSTQISFGARAEHYFRAGRQGVLLLRVRGEGLLNARLFQNDLFRLGGLNSLRGFSENQYYASSYGVGTAEFRQFTGSDSYVFLFADQAYFRNETIRNAPRADQPTGLGAGISFRTAAGVFQFVYSVGRAKQQSFDVAKGKIHFGVTSRF
ncbi:BamA/TamA family outer membrane protein [uncultured Hymenobacter sp.]|uniref:BamA/TamA family outer membrane protein n=1 Tax=uncultured Hymenobacter sp. TaxID=170016 RepID=UPI0035CBFD7E